MLHLFPLCRHKVTKQIFQNHQYKKGPISTSYLANQLPNSVRQFPSMAAPQPSQPRPLSTDFEVLSYINSLMEAFKAFDSNNDGLITSDELRGIMGSLGYNISDREVKEMMRKGDTDGDGLLSMHEFLEMNTRELDLGDLADFLQSAVPVLGLEAQNDEVVTGEELYNVLGSMGSASMEDCMDIIACLDGDGDGAVSLQDLQCIVQALL